MRALILALLFLVSPVYAETVGLQFTNVRIPQLIDVVTKNILQMDYVLSPEVSSLPSSVSINIRKIDKTEVINVLSKTLSGEGVTIEQNNGVLYFAKGSKIINPPVPDSPTVGAGVPQGHPATVAESESVPDNLFSYFPRYRPSEVLNMALRSAGFELQESKDNRRDFLTLKVKPERLKALQTFLAEIDQPTPSVFVKAAIIEVTKSSESNFSLGAIFSMLNGKLTFTIGAPKSYANSASFTNATIDAFISAVDGDSRFRSLAEPQLKVLNGETARLVVGQDVPVKGQAILTNGFSQQSIEYKTAGLVIELEPLIMRDSIIMKIKQSLSDVSSTTTSGIDSPTITKRESSTTITAQDGEMIMLAGMDTQKEISTQSGLSFLPDFLKQKAGTSQNSQLLLLLEVRKLAPDLALLPSSIPE